MKKLVTLLLSAMLVFAIHFAGAQEKQMSKQETSLNALKTFSMSKGSELNFIMDDNGSVNVIYGKLSASIPVVKLARAASEEFLANNKEAFRINDVQAELKLESDFEDALGLAHVKYAQIYKGVPVFERTVTVHIDRERAIHAVTSNYIPEIQVSVNPAINSSAAIMAVKNEKQLGDMPYEKAQLVVYHDDMSRNTVLAYAVHISNLRYNKIHIIDASNGRLIAERELIHAGSVTGTGTNALGGTVNPLYSYTGTDYPYPQQWASYMNPTNGTAQRGTYNMIDVSNPTIGNVFGLCAEKTNLSTINWIHSSSSTFGSTNDGTISVSEQRAAVSAAFNFRSTLNYFKNKHGRNGIDNAGMAVVHITNWYDANDPINAYWSGDPWNYMAFSNAEGSTTYNPLSCAIDVVAHELAHGITDKTSKLAYQNHSGALNESWSDIMGWEVEYYATGQSDWLLGEDIYKSGTSAFRSLSTPTAYQQPDKVGGTYYVTPTSSPSSSNDYGGVHINSGIPNKVFHLLVAGGTHYNVTVSPFSTTLSTSADQVGALAYLVNVGGYYTSTTDFTTARAKWEAACSALFPNDNNKLLSVKRAWYSVNVGTNPDQSTPTDPNEPNDNFSQATQLTSGTAKSGYIGTTTDLDYFKISANSGQTITVNLTNLPADFDLYLFNPSQTQVAKSENSGTTSETINHTATVSGTFYILVKGYNGAMSTTIAYSVKATIGTSVLNVTETTAANDAISSAQNVASIPARITGYFTSTSDNWDYYKFPIAANQAISVSMTVPSGVDYDLFLKNSSGTNLKSSTQGAGVTESFTYTNGSTATTLYIAVQRYSGTSSTAYVININVTSGINAGNGGGDLQSAVPATTALKENYPNPFNPTTTIEYDIAKAGKVSLKIYNLLGQEVRTLVNDYKAEGTYKVQWDGKNNAGVSVSTGMYIYRLQVGDFVATRKMQLIK